MLFVLLLITGCASVPSSPYAPRGEAARNPIEAQRLTMEAAELLEVSPQSASNNIQKLMNAGILREATGRKRNQVFLAQDILQFIGDYEDEEASAG